MYGFRSRRARETSRLLTSSGLIGQNSLKPGDVLLHRSMRQKPHQQAISMITGSPYTHASIYLGGGQIAEATVADGVRIASLSEQLYGDYCVGVLRSQMGFGEARIRKLHEFVHALVEAKARYDLPGVMAYPSGSRRYLQDQLEVIERNFGKFTTAEELVKDSFFCSALVVACYYVVGIIDPSAQVAYPHKLISPADLYSDPTFGWLLGYLLPPGADVPFGDPLGDITSWTEVMDSTV